MSAAGEAPSGKTPVVPKRRARFRPGRFLFLVLLLVTLASVTYAATTTYIAPGEVGVKQVIYGPDKGIREEVFGPGLHLVVPGIERIHRFPSDVQVLNLTGDSVDRLSEDARTISPLNIQTSEGYAVSVDISVLYRVSDPYEILTTIGPGRLYEDSLIIPRAERTLRKQLGALDAEEFYDVGLRLARVNQARDELAAELEPAGFEVLQVFVRAYSYDQRYQEAIELRKIQDQTVFKNQAEAAVATAAAERDRIVAEGAALAKVELARGEAEARKLRAEAELYQRSLRSKGELILKLAEAEGTRLQNAALRGRGGEAMVGLKMAEALEGTKVIVIPTDGPSGLNPLDLDATLKRFDVRN